MKITKSGIKLLKSFLFFSIVALSAKIFTAFVSEPIMAKEGNEIIKILLLPPPLLVLLFLIIILSVDLVAKFTIFLLETFCVEKTNKYL